jgi:hypothetical protein
MKTHGGRSFLRGHFFGDNVHEFLAPCIYEGEGEMLGMAFFKSLVKEHGKRYFEPIGKALQQHQIKNFNPKNPAHLWTLRHELGAYAKWSLGRRFLSRDRKHIAGMDARLAEHVAFAQDMCQRQAKEVSDAMSKHQLKLADRQCRMSELSQRVQDVITILVTAMWAHGQKKDVVTASADVLCQDLRRKLTGARPADSYFRDVDRLADRVIAGEFHDLDEIAKDEILMRY